MSEEMLFVWTFRVPPREFVIEVGRGGECLLYDETIRRTLCHSGKTGHQILWDELMAVDPSPQQMLKREFSISFLINADHLELLQQARAEYDRAGDVSEGLISLIDQKFAAIFWITLNPFLTVPMERH